MGYFTKSINYYEDIIHDKGSAEDQKRPKDQGRMVVFFARFWEARNRMRIRASIVAAKWSVCDWRLVAPHAGARIEIS